MRVNSEREHDLSARQKQIVDLASQGRTDKEIAILLGVEPGTIRTYWDRLRVRFAAKSRTEVVARANQRRLDVLANENEDLLAILGALPQFVWTANPSGHVDYCNDWFGRFSGRSPQECTGLGCRALMLEEDIPASTLRWQRAQDTGEAYEARVRFYRALDGTLRWHAIRLFPLLSSSGEVRKWVGAAHELLPTGATGPIDRSA